MPRRFIDSHNSGDHKTRTIIFLQENVLCMKALENYKECLRALERVRSAWKHLNKRERKELKSERSQGRRCVMIGEGHLLIGEAP